MRWSITPITEEKTGSYADGWIIHGASQQSTISIWEIQISHPFLLPEFRRYTINDTDKDSDTSDCNLEIGRKENISNCTDWICFGMFFLFHPLWFRSSSVLLMLCHVSAHVRFIRFCMMGLFELSDTILVDSEHTALPRSHTVRWLVHYWIMGHGWQQNHHQMGVDPTIWHSSAISTF